MFMVTIITCFDLHFIGRKKNYYLKFKFFDNIRFFEIISSFTLKPFYKVNINYLFQILLV